MIAPDTINELMGDGTEAREGEQVLTLRGIDLVREGMVGVDDLGVLIRTGEVVALVADAEWIVRRLPRVTVGLEHPAAGEVDLLGQAVLRISEQKRLRLRRQVGYLFHNSGLIHNLNVWYNVALPALYHSRFHDMVGVGERVDIILRRCRLTHVRDRRPAALDEYTRKRVALARTWVMSPRLIVIEDPLVDIDTGAGSRFMDLALGPVPSGWEGEDPRPSQAAVFITSQGIHESFFRYVHRLIILREGQVVFADNPRLYDRRGKKDAGDLVSL